MNRIIKTVVYGLVGIVLGSQALSLRSVSAAVTPPALYLTPASGSVVKGDNIKVSVYEDSGNEPINAVLANLTYSTSLFSYVSYSSSSAFTIEATNPSGNTGSLSIARGTITPRTGVQLVTTLTFKAAASSGTAAVNFTSTSKLLSSNTNTNILANIEGGNYTLKTDTTTATNATNTNTTTNKTSSSSTSSSSLNKKTSSSTKTSTAKDKNPPAITDINVSGITSSVAIISWKTSEPSTSVVKYGKGTDHQISVSDTRLVTKHKITLGSGVLSANTTYHYTVKSTDAAGNTATSNDLTFSTSSGGLSAKIKSLKRSQSMAVIYVLAGLILLMTVVVVSFKARRKLRDKAELERHFIDSNNTGGQTPTSGGPTVITPGDS